MISVYPIPRLPLSGKEFSQLLHVYPNRELSWLDYERRIKATSEIATSIHDRELSDQIEYWRRQTQQHPHGRSPPTAVLRDAIGDQRLGLPLNSSSDEIVGEPERIDFLA